MVILYLNNRFFGYKDSYSYSDIDVDKMLIFNKSDHKYFIRYDDEYYTNIIPLQLRINNFYYEIDTYASNNRLMSIYSDDKALFKKCREIWNRITKLIGINNTSHFVRITLNGDKVIMVEVHEKTSFVEGIPKDIKELAIALGSIIYDYSRTSLV